MNLAGEYDKDLGIEFDMCLGWFIGILEGEGHFYAHSYEKEDGKVAFSQRITVEMTDHDVIYKIKEITGMGTINMRGQRPGRKLSWIWTVAKRDDVRELLERIRYRFSARRKAEIEYVLTAIRDHEATKV